MTTEELARQQREADVREVLSSPAGRRFAWGQLLGGGLFAASYAGEALATAYQEGRRSVAIALLLELQRVDPTGYVAMVTEQLDEERRLRAPAK